MESRLLSALNEQASTTRDPVVWARAVCRAASHYARHGRTKEALVSIGVVRQQFGTELHPDMAPWLMLAEGVLHFFQARTHEAYDRIRRAYGLAIALKADSAIPSCAAWMAHVEFFDCAYEKMIAHLEQALQLATTEDHQAQARASLVLANSYHLADQYSLARPWYERARQHASLEGDEATLSAMLYNVAAFRASNVRLAETFGHEIAKEAHRAGMETASSVNFDFAIGTAGLDFLSEMLQGLMLTIEGKYKEALEILDSIEIARVPPGIRSPIIVDIAWCQAILGEGAKSLVNLEVVESVLSQTSEFDDLAYVNSRLAQITAHFGQTELSSQYKARANEALAQHREFQTELLARLQAMKVV